MLQITRQAATHLLRTRAQLGLDDRAGARFVRSSAGIGLTFAEVPEPGDHVLSGSALPIYVAEDVTAALDQALIDVAADDGDGRLVLRSQADAPSRFAEDRNN